MFLLLFKIALAFDAVDAYLKEQAKATNSAFLKRWYEIVKEDSAEIIKDKLEDIKSAKSESDIKDILDAKVTPAQNDKVKKDIDELNQFAESDDSSLEKGL